MTYAYYQQIKRGNIPQNSVSIEPNLKKKESNKMDRYVCTACGYVYDPEVGDRKTKFLPAHPLKICLMTGCVPYVASGKTTLRKRINTLHR